MNSRVRELLDSIRGTRPSEQRAQSLFTLRDERDRRIAEITREYDVAVRALYRGKRAHEMPSLWQVDLQILGHEDGYVDRAMDPDFAHLLPYRAGWIEGLRALRAERDEMQASVVPEVAKPTLQETGPAADVWMARKRESREWALKIRTKAWFDARQEATRAWGCSPSDVIVRPYDPKVARFANHPSSLWITMGAAAAVGAYVFMKFAERK